MAFASYWPNQGWHLRWTRDRVLEQLSVAAAEIHGPLPTHDRPYYELKGGKLHWPPMRRVREYHGSLTDAWMAAGADPSRVTPLCRRWTQEEDDYLLENAGSVRLTTIAAHLGRSYTAVRVRIGSKGHGLRARWNQGFLSAANVAAEYHTSYNRVCRLIAGGRIVATKHPFRRQWSIDPEALTPEVEVLLRAPYQTHIHGARDVGDYPQRHGIYRTRIDGRVVYVREDGSERGAPLIRPWTADEDGYLSLHPDERPAVQAEALGRTPGAVKSRRSILAKRGEYRLSRRRRTLATILGEAGIHTVLCCHCDTSWPVAEASTHRCPCDRSPGSNR